MRLALCAVLLHGVRFHIHGVADALALVVIALIAVLNARYCGGDGSVAVVLPLDAAVRSGHAVPVDAVAFDGQAPAVRLLKPDGKAGVARNTDRKP